MTKSETDLIVDPIFGVPEFDPEDHWYPCFEGERPPDQWMMLCGTPCLPCAVAAEQALNKLNPLTQWDECKHYCEALDVLAPEGIQALMKATTK